MSENIKKTPAEPAPSAFLPFPTQVRGALPRKGGASLSAQAAESSEALADEALADEALAGGTLAGGPAAELMAALGVVVAKVAELDAGVLDGTSATGVLLGLRALTGQLDAVAATVLPIVETTGSWATEGWRSFASWLAVNERISVGAARKQVRLARALRDELPGTALAAVAGEISLEHAHVLTTVAATSDRRRECLAAADEPRVTPEVTGADGGDPTSATAEAEVEAEAGAEVDGLRERVCNEGFLLEQARDLPVDQFRALVRRWSAAADPDACERGFARAQDREYFELSHTLDGYHVVGFLTVEHALGLQAALDAVSGVPTKDDLRTRDQRRAHALADLARLCLDQGLAGTGNAVRPHLSVVVEHGTLLRMLTAPAAATTSTCTGGTGAGGWGTGGTGKGGWATQTFPAFPTVPAGTTTVDARTFNLAEFTDGQPIPRAVLATLACDSTINRIIFGAQSAIIDVGRQERTFTGTKRHAVIACDRHCQYGTCDAPPSLCEIHHVDHWVRDHGKTSVATGILLCWRHHHHVHDKDIEIRRKKNGQWVFTRADGTIL